MVVRTEVERCNGPDYCGIVALRLPRPFIFDDLEIEEADIIGGALVHGGPERQYMISPCFCHGLFE